MISKKVFPDFRNGENIHCDREIVPPPPKLNYDIFLPITFFKNRDMKYNIKRYILTENDLQENKNTEKKLN